MSKSLFAAKFARSTHLTPTSPKPLSQLEIARLGLCASPIDRSEFDPIRLNQAAQQQKQTEKASRDSNHMPFSFQEIAMMQPDLALGHPVHVPTWTNGPVLAAPAPFHPGGNQLVNFVHQAVPLAQLAPGHPALSQPAPPLPAPSSLNAPVQNFSPYGMNQTLTGSRSHRRNNSNGSNPSARHARKLSYRRHSPASIHAMTVQFRNTHIAAKRSHEPTAQEYSELADSYMGSLLWQLEDSESMRHDMEVEEAAGVITVTIVGVGAYIINKQPPNKQIWLSSPITGPKRFDFREVADKGGKWVYSRDQSSLTSILSEELKLELTCEGEGKKYNEVTKKYE